MDKWLHFSDKPITKVYLTEKQNKFDLKPYGFWFSLNDEWKNWCNSEGFRNYKENNYYTYELKLDENKIFIIDTYEKVKEFSEKYKHQNYINWQTVSKDYDGLIFRNYYDLKQKLRIENKLTEYLWFYSVDVNGGVIWNPSCIKEFSLLNN